MQFIRNKSFAILFLVLSMLAAVGAQSRAQLAGTVVTTSTLPPPPAFAIARRMAAWKDYQGAIKKLGDVPSSATYKHTPYAPEAIYSVAHLYEDNLKDDIDAITSLNTLVNNYSLTDYPHRNVVPAERLALSKRIDTENAAAASRGVVWASGNPIYDIWEAILSTGYLVIHYAVNLTGAKSWSYWFALLLISVIVRLLLTPLTLKQYKSMRETQRITPLVKELQAKYKNDKVTLNQKTMELYKEHNVNPAAGCLPMLLQFPVFIYMYHAVWLYQYHFSNGTFAWINPTTHRLFPAIIGANLADQDIILLGLYSISMYVTQRMMPAADPAQAEMQKSTALMSSVFFFIFFQNYHFPSAFVLYWLISNVLSTLTQLYFMKQGLIPPRGTMPILPSDGDNSTGSGANGSSNGFGKIVMEAPQSGSPMLNGNGTGGAAKGVIAPKVHPKKKRR